MKAEDMRLCKYNPRARHIIVPREVLCYLLKHHVHAEQLINNWIGKRK